MSAFSQVFEDEKALQDAIADSPSLVREHIAKIENELSLFRDVFKAVSGAKHVWYDKSEDIIRINYEPEGYDA